MNDNDWKALGIAIFIAILLLRGVIRAIRGRSRNQMDRINQAAERVLKEQQQAARNPGRASTPLTQPKTAFGSTAKAKPRPTRAAATAQKPRTPSAALANVRTPAVVRTGLSGGKEPVIQRRR
jgi:hypothetical protein